MSCSAFQQALRAFLLTLLSAFWLGSGAASAATILGSSVPVTEGGTGDDFNLTTLGTSDWTVWNSTSIGTDAATPTNSMSGGVLISDLSAIGGGAVRGTGSGNNTAADFMFTNGTPVASATIGNAVGAFNTGLDVLGSGISFTLTLPTTSSYTILIWGAGFEVTQGTLTASLSGATNFVDTLLTAGSGAPKSTRLYTLTATPDSPGDVITIQLAMTGQTAGLNSHVLISGAAMSVVPEPATLLLLILGIPALALSRAFRNPNRA